MSITVKSVKAVAGQHKHSCKLLRVLLPAVALLFIISALLFIFRPTPEPVHRIGESVSWDMHITQPIVPIANVFISYDLESSTAAPFVYSEVVEAKITEILPDTYTVPKEILGGNRWHILKMQTLDIVIGKNMPRAFYLMLPEHYSTELSAFDSFIIAMHQRSLDEYTLINTNQCRYESFSPIFMPSSGSPAAGEVQSAISTSDCTFSILPLRNGFLDASIWDEDMWHAENYAKKLLSRESVFPVKYGYSRLAAKIAILAYREKNRQYLRPFNGRFFSWKDYPTEAVDFAARFLPFEDGTYSQSLSFSNYKGRTEYTRVVNGFVTNERHIVNENGTTEESAVVFTEADIDKLPDLTAVLKATLAEKPEGCTDTTTLSEVRAGYHKDGETLFGYIRVAWGDRNKEVAAKNLIIHSDGTMQELPLEEWKLYRTNK
ncbi:MAG: hypothetical protein IKU07_07165 [Oscillospiraceae bacterium]|nr:hypothetical protein [Oscillospiraceae bacterium]